MTDVLVNLSIDIYNGDKSAVGHPDGQPALGGGGGGSGAQEVGSALVIITRMLSLPERCGPYSTCLTLPA